MTTIREQAKDAWRGEHYNDQCSRGPEESYIAGYMAAMRKQLALPATQLSKMISDIVYVRVAAGWYSGTVMTGDRVLLDGGQAVRLEDIWALAPHTCELAQLQELWPQRGLTVHY